MDWMEKYTTFVFIYKYKNLGGYDESQYNEDNEDVCKTIYQFVYERKTMKPIARMITLRNHFSLVCSMDK